MDGWLDLLLDRLVEYGRDLYTYIYTFLYIFHLYIFILFRHGF